MILSNALDTNGQNARYVSAALKHGDSPRILKALAIGNYDPAGVAERFRIASQKVEGLEIRSAHRTVAYFDFPQDLQWTRHNTPEILRIARLADVIHLNNSPLAAQKLRLRKPFLLHHHGTLFRNDPQRMLDWARRARAAQAVSTVDLMRPAPELLHWLPTAYDVEELRKYRRRDYFDERIHIVHAPTNREGKHTALFVKATDELIAEGLPLRVTIVEGRTNAECLQVKGTADIVYDQLLWGYGCNSVEAWAMGIPVISGADDWTFGQMRKLWGEAPFYRATEETLKQRIKDMVLSAKLRTEWAGIGQDHVNHYHDELPALERLIELYRMAIAARTRRIPGKGPKPVTFRYRPGRSVWVDDQRVVFDRAGFASVEDPYQVEQLRRRKVAGIEEVA